MAAGRTAGSRQHSVQGGGGTLPGRTSPGGPRRQPEVRPFLTRIPPRQRASFPRTQSGADGGGPEVHPGKHPQGPRGRLSQDPLREAGRAAGAAGPGTRGPRPPRAPPAARSPCLPSRFPSPFPREPPQPASTVAAPPQPTFTPLLRGSGVRAPEARPPRAPSRPLAAAAAPCTIARPPPSSRFAPARGPPRACALRSAAAAAESAASGSVFLKGNAEAPGVTVGEGTPSRGDPPREATGPLPE